MNATTRRRLLPGFLVVFGVAIFANAVTAPFVFDDSNAIEENPYIGQLWPPTSEPQTPLAGRPVVAFTMAVNHAISGLHPAGFRVVNIAIHILATLTLYGIVRRTLVAPVFGDRFTSTASGLAFACGLLWMVHPLHGDSVVYITQRTQSLMGLFYLLTIYMAVRARTAAAPAAWIVGAVAACGLGMASKESMVTAPVVVVLYDVAFRDEPVARLLRRRWGLYVGLAATWIILAILMLQGPRSATVGFEGDVTALTYALNQCGVILRYLRLLVWPSPLSIDYGSPIPMTLADAAPAVAAILVLGLAAVALYTVRPRLGFALVAFFVLLAPTSSVVPITTEVAAERRMYLPLAALVSVVVVGVFSLLRNNRRFGVGLAAIVVVALAVTTVRRNAVFHEPLRLWQTAVDTVPENSRAHNNLANALEAAGRGAEAFVHYQRSSELRGGANVGPEAEALGLYNMGRALYQQGRYAEAIDHYRRALRVRADATTHNNLGLALQATGVIDEAIDHYRRAAAMDPADARPRTNLGRALLGRGDTDRAIESLRAALAIDSTLGLTVGALADAYLTRGEVQEAMTHYQRAIELRPRDPDQHAGLGYALRAAGRRDEARIRFERALALDPEHARAHDGLGGLLAERGQVDAAIAHFRRAIARERTLVSAHVNLGSTLGAAGRHSEAITALLAALALDSGDVGAHENLGLAYVMSGRMDDAMAHLESGLTRWPDRPVLLRTLAFALVRHPDPARRNATRAVRLGTRAVELTDYRDGFAVTTLVAAHVAAGDRAEAIRVTRRGLEAAEAAGDAGTQARLRQVLTELGGG